MPHRCRPERSSKWLRKALRQWAAIVAAGAAAERSDKNETERNQ
jgi:hypothetical protein